MEDARAVKKNVRNSKGKMTQELFLVDGNNKHTRDAYFDLNSALDQVYQNFQFEDGKKYDIKYLTNDGRGWKGAKGFLYTNGMNLSTHVYSAEMSEILYEEDSLDSDFIRVYGIVVQEL